MLPACRYSSGMTAERLRGEVFEEALASAAPAVQEALRTLVADSAFVEPRVVSHLRD